MPSDKYNSIMAMATGLIFHCLTLLQPDMCLLAYYSIYNAFFMDLPVLLCVPFIFAIVMKSVNLTVLRNGFLSQRKSFKFFIVATLIAEVLFK